MIGLGEQLAIVTQCGMAEVKAFAVVVALAVTAGIAAFPVVRRFRRIGLPFLAVAAGLWVFGAGKRPDVTWDVGIYDNGSIFDTNTWMTVNFKWRHVAPVIGTDRLYFATVPKAQPEDEPTLIGSETVSVGEWSHTFASGFATNYNYYAYLIGEVHTNGVWLGNILQKEMPGTCGPDRMVIIKGKLDVDGRTVAPFKED